MAGATSDWDRSLLFPDGSAAMKIRAFLIADAVTTSQGKSYIHGGSITQIAGEFPFTQPALSVFLRLERENEELGTDHLVEIRLLTPGGDEMVQLTTNTRIPGGAAEDYPMTVDFVGQFYGLRFEAPGLYHFAASIDGSEVDRIPLALETEEGMTQWTRERTETKG
jgi:hypothetical protein